MKRNAALFTIVIASLFLLYAQDNPSTEMTGWICSSACVTQTPGHAACDANCAANDKSGQMVFVSDDGKISKISNPDIAKGKMGQQVKVKCKMDKEKQSMEIIDFLASIR
jgi:hypothetical protein